MVDNSANTYLSRIVFAMIGGALEGKRKLRPTIGGVLGERVSEIVRDGMKQLALEHANQAAEDIPAGLTQEDCDAITNWFPTMTGVAADFVLKNEFKTLNKDLMSPTQLALVDRVFFQTFESRKAPLTYAAAATTLRQPGPAIETSSKQQPQPRELHSEGITDMPLWPRLPPSPQPNHPLPLHECDPPLEAG
jgi:hypothetical protein